MADKKTDRRTLKTRKAIFESLAELLTEKELRNITVQELSDKADFHRITFYKHFMDVYDAYDQLEELILSDLMLIITEQGEKLNYEVYPVVFKYITDNPKYFRMIFSPHNTSTLYQKVLKMVEGLNRVIWSEKYGVDIKDDLVSCVIRYHSNGCLSIIAGWVLSGFKELSDFIIKTLSELDKNTQDYLSARLGK